MAELKPDVGMKPTLSWQEADQASIATHWQPALLIDLLIARDFSSHHILRGSGIFYEDIVTGQQRMSANQLLQLISNARRLDEADLSFRWGNHALPGHCGCFSQLLASAVSLRDFLTLLTRYHRVFSPLLVPHRYEDQHSVYVHWIPASGLGEHHAFLAEVAMTSVVSACQWFYGQRLPWRFAFAHPAPNHIEQYWLNLGEAIQFEAGMDVMKIDRAWLDKPFQQHNSPVSQAARQVLEQECQRQWQADYHSPLLPEAVYQWLMAHIQQPNSLEQVAQAFAMSPATFKRKLKKHQVHFQAIQDRARLQTSVYLLYVRGWTNEQVADYLNFNDTTNFRRAFKRWCGLTPSDSKYLLSLV